MSLQQHVYNQQGLNISRSDALPGIAWCTPPLMPALFTTVNVARSRLQTIGDKRRRHTCATVSDMVCGNSSVYRETGNYYIVFDLMEAAKSPVSFHMLNLPTPANILLLHRVQNRRQSALLLVSTNAILQRKSPPHAHHTHSIRLPSL